MAVWLVERDLKVTYTGADGVVRDCGRAAGGIPASEVVAWVISSASVGDVVRTPEGVFVRQFAPNVN